MTINMPTILMVENFMLKPQAELALPASNVDAQQLFALALKELRSLSMQDLLNDKALSLLNTCWAFIQKAFPAERSELHRKIAYHLFNNLAIPAHFLDINRHLDVLRILIYSKSQLDVAFFKAVILKVYQDLKGELATPSPSTTVVTSNPTPYLNPKALKDLTVSFGTGEDFFREIQAGNHSGYQLEFKSLQGIFVSPHDGSKSLEEFNKRTRFYATRSPFKHFDKPLGVSFNVATDKLSHVNYNPHEVVILTDDLKNIPKEIIMERYDYINYFGQIPAYIDSKAFSQNVKATYEAEIAQKILDLIKSTQSESSLFPNLN
jgi:hypothetical protein